MVDINLEVYTKFKIQNLLKSVGVPQDDFIFQDKNGNKYIAFVEDSDEHYLSIEVYSEKDETKAGYMRFCNRSIDGYFLSGLYVYANYRGLGIASKMEEIANAYLARKSNRHYVYGLFKPYQLETDEIDWRQRDEIAMRKQAENFYVKHNYRFVKAGEPGKELQKYGDLFEELYYYKDSILCEFYIVKDINKKATLENYVLFEGQYVEKSCIKNDDEEFVK